MNWKITLISLLVFVVIIFTVQNYEVVKIRFFFWALEASGAVILFLTLIIGIIIGWIVSIIGRKE